MCEGRMALFFSSTLAYVAYILAACYLMLRVYTSYAFKYWEKRGVHYIKSASLLGNTKDVTLRRKHLSEYLQEVYEENADQPYVGLFIMRKPVLMVRDLSLLRSIFVKDAQVFLDRNTPHPRTGDLFTRSLFALTGKRWRDLRIKLTPTFTSGKIKRMFPLINECGKELLPCIEQEISKDGTVLVKDMVGRYSTDVIASCAFGVNANALADPKSEFRATMKKILEPSASRIIASTVSGFLPRVRRFIAHKIFDPRVYDFVRKTFWDVADYRKKNKVVRNDFVDLLVQIKREGQVQTDDAEELEEIERDNLHVNKVLKKEKYEIDLEDNDILAQAFIFILAGYETSSSVITQTLFELALHPDIQRRLKQEVQAIIDKHNNEITYDAIAEMTYLDMVVSETMRKYPTLPTLERMCLSDYKIQGTNFTIEKGTKIVIPVKAIHYDPDIYPDPQKFDPERFSIENKSKRSNFAYLPFGEGPRICIGMRFGQMQVKTALVHILTSYQVRPCSDTPKSPLALRPGPLIFAPKQNVVLAFTKLK